jgi:preprotein translocase subunit SecG
MTAVFAIVFFVISLVLGNMYTHKGESQWVDPTQGQVIEQAADTASDVPAENSDEIPQ